ncbi:MAG: hypothetical protein ABFD96_02275 [Armatimonadia bacterium]
MRLRRVFLMLTIVLAATTAMLVLLQSVPFAQEGAPPGPGAPPGGPPGAEAGMPGMPGAPGGAPAGGGLTWKEYKAPDELARTYPEHLARTGPSDAKIPPQYLFNQDGTPKRATPNEWFQLQRIYKKQVEAAAGAEANEPGRIGAGMDRYLTRWDAYDYHAGIAVIQAHIDGANSFKMEVGYPQLDVQSPGGATVPVRLPVIMRVKPSAQAYYPEKVYKRLKKFDTLGQARAQGNTITNSQETFRIITRKGGFYHPRILNLPRGSGANWTALWASTAVVAVLKDKSGKIMATSSAPANIGPDPLAKILYPDTIYFNPRYKLLIWPEGRKINGKRWNVSGTKGWAYEFTFNLTRAQLRRLHTAEAKFVSPMVLGMALIAGDLKGGDIETLWDQLDKTSVGLSFDEMAKQLMTPEGRNAAMARVQAFLGASVPAAGAAGAGPGAGPGAEPGMAAPAGPGGPGPGGMPPAPGAPPM